MSPIAPISPPLRATLKEVADQAGVSVITASRVLNGGRSGLPVSEATRQRVETSAAELGYRPHASGRTLRTRRTGQVGTLVLNNRDKPLTNIPAYEYLLGINAGLEPADVLMTQVRLTDLDGADPGRIRVLRECTLDGFVVTGSIPAAVSEFLLRHCEHTIWLDTDRDAAYDCVRRDEVAAGAAAAGLLIRAGRSRIVWMQRPSRLRDHYSLRDREAGARRACAEAGVEFIEHPGAPYAVPFDAAAVLREVSRPGTGLLLVDPGQTRWAAPFLAGHGLVPGRDLGVACCDADVLVGDAWPDLSRVQPDRYALGMLAADMLLARIADGRPVASRTLAARVIAGSTA